MIDYQSEKEITALLEKQISESSEEERIKSTIENNADLKNEFIVQSFIKNITGEKLKFYRAPDNLKEKILKKINSGTINSPYIYKERSRKLIIYSSLFLIILGIIFLIKELFF